MRENLGWQSSCREPLCPQEWLKLSVTELPTAIQCGRCGQQVRLVLKPEELGQLPLAALPVVPCSALPGGPPQPAVETPSKPQSVPPQRANWVITLKNSGHMVRVDREHLVIGRSRNCDVVVPSAKVSRQHASVALLGGELFIEDLGSANGVWRGGEKLSRARVASGDVFTLSDQEILFEIR